VTKNVLSIIYFQTNGAKPITSDLTAILWKKLLFDWYEDGYN